eukprot:CAMPEP_0119017834 /NCGR_PEP_ID=MMETSP1176-20130426/17831_1 /TAXON_ID=265551 /ORGANISM="Synedropsis recta cf, Strain CCMP1620" /LENGTH=157 /DNA_ID=CAMNT_0006971677 /DNA_START=150 /DNA_END=621 /DNA_ORIENTATION=-
MRKIDLTVELNGSAEQVTACSTTLGLFFGVPIPVKGPDWKRVMSQFQHVVPSMSIDNVAGSLAHQAQNEKQGQDEETSAVNPASMTSCSLGSTFSKSDELNIKRAKHAIYSTLNIPKAINTSLASKAAVIGIQCGARPSYPCWLVGMVAWWLGGLVA